MKCARKTEGRWRRNIERAAIGFAPVFIVGCVFGAEGMESPAGLGCSKDLRAAAISINLTPYADGFLTGTQSAGATSDEFLIFGQAFAIEWQYAYDGFFPPTPGSAGHAYTTHIEIREDGEIVWEKDVASDPVKLKDEGADAVIVGAGLPRGFYEVVIQLDPDEEVPECDNLGAIVNNIVTMQLPVWGSNGPPQTPTPCQEAELGDCPE